MSDGKTIRERIVEHLAHHPEGLDDDELAQVLELKQRQQANSRCRQLHAEGVIARREVNGKLRNFLLGAHDILSHNITQGTSQDDEQPWFWEGNVQQVVVEYLRSQGCVILQTTNTASHQHGKDIIATGPEGVLWVTVKGYPKGTPRTHPGSQAGHWFKHAMFDIIAYRSESSEAALAIALPDFPRYRKLIQKATWLLPIARFSFIWVQEDGTVIVE